MLLCVGLSNIVDAQTFSVSPDKKVYFSPGNLQWSATGGGNTATTHVSATGTAAGTWRFSENQYDYIGSSNSYISSYYSGWIDLFGWGTSGYESNGYGSKPYTSAIDPHTYTLPYNIIDMSLTNHEWGTYNAIYNPKTGTTDAPGTWRSLTKDEWEYLFKTRPDAVSKYGIACVNGVNGMIILPDSWTLPDGLTFKNASENHVNEYTLPEWREMEAAGAIFLPAAGNRGTDRMYGVWSTGLYWAATYEFISQDYVTAMNFGVGASTLNIGDGINRSSNASVRLVKDE